ncbi:hypothetical protein, partial [Trueperella pyogenes]
MEHARNEVVKASAALEQAKAHADQAQAEFDRIKKSADDLVSARDKAAAKVTAAKEAVEQAQKAYEAAVAAQKAAEEALEAWNEARAAGEAANKAAKAAEEAYKAADPDKVAADLKSAEDTVARLPELEKAMRAANKAAVDAGEKANVLKKDLADKNKAAIEAGQKAKALSDEAREAAEKAAAAKAASDKAAELAKGADEAEKAADKAAADALTASQAADKALEEADAAAQKAYDAYQAADPDGVAKALEDAGVAAARVSKLDADRSETNKAAVAAEEAVREAWDNLEEAESVYSAAKAEVFKSKDAVNVIDKVVKDELKPALPLLQKTLNAKQEAETKVKELSARETELKKEHDSRKKFADDRAAAIEKLKARQQQAHEEYKRIFKSISPDGQDVTPSAEAGRAWKMSHELTKQIEEQEKYLKGEQEIALKADVAWREAERQAGDARHKLNQLKEKWEVLNKAFIVITAKADEARRELAEAEALAETAEQDVAAKKKAWEDAKQAEATADKANEEANNSYNDANPDRVANDLKAAQDAAARVAELEKAMRAANKAAVDAGEKANVLKK